MFNEHEIQKEIEKTKEARRLGGYDKSCIRCSENDPRCLESHHLSGRGYGNEVVTVCRNCHRKLTVKNANTPPPGNPSQLDHFGNWLLGIALFLFELALKAFEYGTALIEAAKVCPAPFGYAAAAV